MSLPVDTDSGDSDDSNPERINGLRVKPKIIRTELMTSVSYL